jgi:large subunit ribosomal protein L4
MALKQYNPTSPGRRQLVLVDKSELHKGRPEKSLVEGLSKSGALIVLDEAKPAEPKTAALRASFEKIGVTNALVIAGPEVDANLKLAARNIPNVDVLPNAGLNVYDVLRRQTLVLTKDAVEAIQQRFQAKEAA